MRAPFALALVASLLLATPALALTVIARVSGGNIAIRSGPGEHYAIIGRAPNGSEIPIDQCTQRDSDSRRSDFDFGGAASRQWCHIPDQGWVDRTSIVGRGLVSVTPPDFAGPGW